MHILLIFSIDCRRKEKTFPLFQERDSEPCWHTASPNTGSGATTTRDVGKCPHAARDAVKPRCCALGSVLTVHVPELPLEALQNTYSQAHHPAPVTEVFSPCLGRGSLDSSWCRRGAGCGWRMPTPTLEPFCLLCHSLGRELCCEWVPMPGATPQKCCLLCSHSSSCAEGPEILVCLQHKHWVWNPSAGSIASPR